MKKYKIQIEEILMREVVVTASSASDAVAKIRAMYDKGEIILDADDFANVGTYVISDHDIVPGKHCPHCHQELCWNDDYDESISYPYYCPHCDKAFTEDYENNNNTN